MIITISPSSDTMTHNKSANRLQMSYLANNNANIGNIIGHFLKYNEIRHTGVMLQQLTHFVPFSRPGNDIASGDNLVNSLKYGIK